MYSYYCSYHSSMVYIIAAVCAYAKRITSVPLVFMSVNI